MVAEQGRASNEETGEWQKKNARGVAGESFIGFVELASCFVYSVAALKNDEAVNQGREDVLLKAMAKFKQALGLTIASTDGT